MIAFTLAWLLSVGSLVLFGTLFPQGLDGGSRLGLCLVPWIVLAGWPRSGSLVRKDALVPFALALAPLMLAHLTDVAHRTPNRTLTFGLSLVFLGLLVAAAVAATASPARQLRYSASWLFLILVVPLLAGATAWIGGETPQALAWLQRASPLDWAWREATGLDNSPWLPLLVCSVILALATTGERVSAEEPIT